MKNWKRFLSLLFVAVLLLQVGGLSAGADYDPSVTGDEPLTIAVYVPVTDEYGGTSSALLDGEAVTLPEGKTLEIRLGDTYCWPNSVYSLSALMWNDLVVTPPEGYYISEAYIYGSDPYGGQPASLKAVAEYPSLTGTRLTLEHENFVDEDSGCFDSARLTTTGGAYTLLLRLELMEDIQGVNLSYSGGDAFVSVPWGESGPVGTGFTVQSPSEIPEGKSFVCWALTYGNGAAVDVAPGAVIYPYADCTLVAQWEDVPYEEPAPHEHSYTEEILFAPTCTDDGLKSLSCDCGYSYTEVIPATGHSYVETVVPPTTEAEGYTEHVCSVCGDSYRDNYQPKLEVHEHSYTEAVTTAQTCTAPGLKTFTCSCGDSYTQEIPATGHSYVETVIAPTTEAEGYTEHVCSVCGDSYRDNYQPKLEVHEHSYTEAVTTAPTCTAPGLKTFTCSCGDSYTQEIPATGHNYVGAVTTEATCTEPGVMTYTCSVCGDSYTEAIPAHGHEFIETVVPPTTVSDGYTLHTCKEGDYEYRDSVVPKSELTVLPAPTLSTSEWTRGSNSTLKLTVNYAFSKFERLLMDGTELTRGMDYNAYDGSTVVEISSGTLEKFLNGSHTVKLVFTDAESSTTFTIKDAPAPEKTTLVVKAKDRTAEYSGQNITANDYEIVSGTLASGDRLELEYGGGSVNVTNNGVGSITKLTVFDQNNQNVTGNYNVTVQPGVVRVTARPLTISGQNAEKAYDGNAFSIKDEYATKISSDRLSNHAVSVSIDIYQNGSMLAEARQPGSYDIMLTAFSVKENGVDVTSNYSFTGTLPYKLGTLTITGSPATMTPVTVTAKSQTWTYDGQAHECKEYTLSAPLSDGDTMSVSFDPASSITNVGSVTNKISTVTIKDKNGAAVAFALNGQGSGKYNVTLADGTLKVDPFKLTLTAVSDEKYYDGTALKNDNVKASSLVSGHKFSVVKFAVTDSKGNLIKNGPVEVGTYTKKVTDVVILDGKGNDVTKNYDITKVDGTLKVLQGSANGNKSPRTGDENNLGLWIGLLAASAVVVLGIVAFFYLRNRKNAARAAAQERRDSEHDSDSEIE